MTPERQAAIRAALERDDPTLYRPGNFSARHDYDVKWELLLALEAAQERIAALERGLERVRDMAGSHTVPVDYPIPAGWQEVYTTACTALEGTS